VTVESLRRTLAVLRERYPFVLIDLPRGGDLFAAAALQDADHVLIVTQATVPSLRNATRLQQGLMAGGVRRDSIGVVLNRYDANHAHLTSAEIEKHLGKPLFALVPNDYDRVTASSEWGRPIHLYAPESPVRPAVVQMARRIAGIGQEPEDTPVRGRGLISRLFGRAVAGSGPRP
jgi:pilus assembly protein CpaE